MSIWEKIKAGFARFAQGRNGMDNLGMFMFFTGLFLQLLDSVLGIGVLYIPGTALYVWALSACSPEILLSYLQVASAAGARVGRKNARMLKV